MPIGPVDPYPEKSMEKTFPLYTVCEVLRQIYHEAEGNDSIRLKCRIAVTMAKAMDTKLREYNEKFVNDYYMQTSTKEMNDHVRKALEHT